MIPRLAAAALVAAARALAALLHVDFEEDE
jgi:hypothetical protein